MPRVADPRNEIGRNKTEKWRGKLRAARIPESCQVDTAVAAAVAVVMADRLEQHPDLSPDLQIILATARAVLKQRGFDGRGPSTKLMSRLFHRKDLPELPRAKRSAPKGRENGGDDESAPQGQGAVVEEESASL